MATRPRLPSTPHLLAVGLLLALRTWRCLRRPERHGPEMSAAHARSLQRRAALVTACAAVTFALAFVAPSLNAVAMLPALRLVREGSSGIGAAASAWAVWTVTRIGAHGPDSALAHPTSVG